MSGRPVKRSLTLQGHRTSVSLEDEFWKEFRRLATLADKPVNQLAAEIDQGRGVDIGLASAIRLYVLRAVLREAGRGDGPAR
ncbi:ribbon-helix-helix domain-containing protein [Oceanicola sp. S124]|uniref:ribbon-helix-helix domain-containing protein n=1 Tax=Oceanicola sp. S124 TaxID=1042378 RepID=UPI0002557925|nr:ribbon-helix-helix domain-containing protein [Oceanicola sp. S124]